MLDPLLNQSTIPLLEQVAAFGQRRHQVLAGNIANIDTPGYKTRDLPMQDFEQALARAVQVRRENLQPRPIAGPSHGMAGFPSLQPYPSAHAADDSLQALGGYPVYRVPPQSLEAQFPSDLRKARTAPPANLTFHDGGNRSIEHESMEMSKNAALQSFAIEVMVTQMRMLETVIAGRI